MPWYVCEHCGDDFKRAPAPPIRRFCSSSCDGQYKLTKNVEKVREAKSFNGCRPASAKRYALVLWGHKCNICNLTEWLGKPIPLVLDHIDGDSEDGSFENTRLICCNCDAQSPYYKGKNRGNGRHYRRQRYAIGKSY